MRSEIRELWDRIRSVSTVSAPAGETLEEKAARLLDGRQVIIGRFPGQTAGDALVVGDHKGYYVTTGRVRGYSCTCQWHRNTGGKDRSGMPYPCSHVRAVREAFVDPSLAYVIPGSEAKHRKELEALATVERQVNTDLSWDDGWPVREPSDARTCQESVIDDLQRSE